MCVILRHHLSRWISPHGSLHLPERDVQDVAYKAHGSQRKAAVYFIRLGPSHHFFALLRVDIFGACAPADTSATTTSPRKIAMSTDAFEVSLGLIRLRLHLRRVVRGRVPRVI